MYGVGPFSVGQGGTASEAPLAIGLGCLGSCGEALGPVGKGDGFGLRSGHWVWRCLMGHICATALLGMGVAICPEHVVDQSDGAT